MEAELRLALGIIDGDGDAIRNESSEDFTFNEDVSAGVQSVPLEPQVGLLAVRMRFGSDGIRADWALRRDDPHPHGCHPNDPRIGYPGLAGAPGWQALTIFSVYHIYYIINILY